MKQGKTVLKDGKNGFPPSVEVGNDDRAVNVFIGPVWIRIRAIDPGNSYNVAIDVHGNVIDRPATSSHWNELIVEANPDAIREWQHGNERAQ